MNDKLTIKITLGLLLIINGACGRADSDDYNRTVDLQPLTVNSPSRALRRSDDTILNKCLGAFGLSRGEIDVEATRIFHSSIQVLGVGSTVTDSEETDEPRLIIIKPAISIFTFAKFTLENPNGLYCFDVNVNIISKTQIDLHCDAQLTDLDGNINVFARGESGVNVLSNVKISRTHCD